MSTQTSTAAASAAAGERSSLPRPYPGRGVLAGTWPLAFAGSHDDVDAVAITVLVAHPSIDAVSQLIDRRAVPDGSERRVTAFNGVLSTPAAVAAAGADPSLDVLSPGVRHRRRSPVHPPGPPAGLEVPSDAHPTRLTRSLPSPGLS